MSNVKVILSNQIHISNPIKGYPFQSNQILSNETNVSTPIRPECSGDEWMLTMYYEL